mmetsp:Transcript_21032/g.52443  ORF Transcript_21032/g.52443 Transcript_21032/m.52443 type:complete len:301 (+) Transcript_21032:261-1163(+)
MFLNTGASTSSGSAKFRAANTQPLRSEFGTVAPPDLDLDFACSSWTHHASKPPEHRKRVAASGKELASDQRRSLVSASRQPRSAPSENVPRCAWISASRRRCGTRRHSSSSKPNARCIRSSGSMRSRSSTCSSTLSLSTCRAVRLPLETTHVASVAEPSAAPRLRPRTLLGPPHHTDENHLPPHRHLPSGRAQIHRRPQTNPPRHCAPPRVPLPQCPERPSLPRPCDVHLPNLRATSPWQLTLSRECSRAPPCLLVLAHPRHQRTVRAPPLHSTPGPSPDRHPALADTRRRRPPSWAREP